MWLEKLTLAGINIRAAGVLPLFRPACVFPATGIDRAFLSCSPAVFLLAAPLPESFPAPFLWCVSALAAPWFRDISSRKASNALFFSNSVSFHCINFVVAMFMGTTILIQTNDEHGILIKMHTVHIVMIYRVHFDVK